jgi:hypothetical protein
MEVSVEKGCQKGVNGTVRLRGIAEQRNYCVSRADSKPSMSSSKPTASHDLFLGDSEIGIRTPALAKSEMAFLTAGLDRLASATPTATVITG